ncbi:MAG: tetratricopeptide repeat protein [Planctomycetota bacterium]|nr:tetratricopeptide repeat protein [Planctomycetota bacterium]
MNGNQQQGQLLLQHGFVSAEVLQRMLGHPELSAHRDLCEFLVRHEVIDLITADQVRQHFNSTQSADYSSKLQVSGSHYNSKILNYDSTRSAVHEIVKYDPLFTPHSDIVFERLEKLGEGGMGAVYRVHDGRLRREAALKILSADPADEKAVERFLREARITASLSHPNIPPIYELGKTKDNEHYMLMKVIEGETLEAAILTLHNQEDNFEERLRELLEALVKVGEALAYAHANHIVHRDLKPANIMIGEFGEILLMDWGLAKDLRDPSATETAYRDEDLELTEMAEKEGLTIAGVLLGTPGYMAPEQLDGDSTVRSDIFALGVILTELLTGKASVEGNTTLERVVATASGVTRSPRDLNRTASKELDILAKMALERDVDNRLESAALFVENLQAYLSGGKLGVYQYSLRESFLRWSSRRPGLIVSLAIGILLVSSLGSINQALEESEQARDVAVAVAGKAKSQEEQAKDREEKIKEAFRILQALESKTKRGAPEKVVLEGIQEALMLGDFSYSVLLSAAKICRIAKIEYREKELLERAARDSKTAYEALFMLHEIEQRQNLGGGFYVTPPLLELTKRAKANGDKNEMSITLDALSFYQKGEHEEALRLMLPLESYSMNFTLGYSLRGTIKVALNDFQGGIEDFNVAIASDPNYAEGYYNRGVARRENGDKAGALADFSHAIRLRPSYALAYFNRGSIHGRAGRWQESINDFDVAIKINPNYFSAYLSRGAMKETLRDHVGAFADYDRAVRLKPKDADAHYKRGVIRGIQGDAKGAWADYDLALKYNPRLVTAYVNRGNLKEKANDFKGAIADFGRALECNPKFVKAYFNRASAKQRQGQLAEALVDFNLALKYDPEYAIGYYGRAVLKLSQKKSREAALDFERCLQYDPNYVQGPKMRNFIKDQLGRPSRY